MDSLLKKLSKCERWGKFFNRTLYYNIEYDRSIHPEQFIKLLGVVKKTIRRSVRFHHPKNNESLENLRQFYSQIFIFLSKNKIFYTREKLYLPYSRRNQIKIDDAKWVLYLQYIEIEELGEQHIVYMHQNYACNETTGDIGDLICL